VASSGRAPDPAATGARGHAFVVDLEHPALTPGDAHHLQRVLRLAPGDPVTISDGAGGWRMARLGRSAAVEPDGAVHHVVPPLPVLTVCFAVVKRERPEWTVQKLTECGVDRIVPIVTERSVVRWDDERAARQQHRLEVIAREAAMQSRRVWLPEVTRVTTFAEAAAMPGASLAERLGPPPTLDRPVVLVGPEGGWSPAELAADIPHVGLGPNVLRAETAAVAAGLLLAGLRAGVVHPA
jgi:16S rRNA (uracil1498-N3)-methyltransferase